ncbi:nucleoside hydrolase [Pelagibacterium montanilacus]|uniref:nucleoside hydrolase n=1 Tax=Pelagibacterium montanilacus TaxID=2185280 RepID=UPI000F8D9108|nr:nucleoside hydrolase [Pelagibacterium montanilacus]
MAPNRLILDTDGGVDDAQALLMLLANDRAPDAITTVFGNVGCDAATRNILAVLAVAEAGDIPVHQGAHAPLVQPVIDARYIHGEDGLGGAPRPASLPELRSADAIGFLRTSSRDAAARGEKVDILMIGPLTNLATALRLEPSIVSGIGRLTIMGGTLHGRGNTTPAAEFNIYADPESAAIVFEADIETLVVPWEPCVSHFMDGPDVDALLGRTANSPQAEFSRALVSHARSIIAGYGGGDVFRFVDPLAAAVVIDPSIVTRAIEASVAVVLAPGLARGMTLVDPSGRLGTPPVTLVETARLDRVVEFYAHSIADRKPAQPF